MNRTALLLVGLLAATALTGCFGSTSPAPDTGTNQPPAGDTGGSTPPPAGGTTPPPPAGRADVRFEDAGAIEGPFEKAWPLDVPDAAYRQANVQFSLQGMQEGAPPTARVYVTLLDPQGASVRSATVGLGGENGFDWSFAPGELSQGQYTLKATAEATQVGGVPSIGFAQYEVSLLTQY